MSKNDYVVAIPSYQRAVTLSIRTWPLLEARGVDMDRVTVFVASPEEKESYAATLPGGARIVIAEPGMMAVRNFIQQYYAEGTRLVQIDDDIRDLVYLVPGDPPRTAPVTNIDDVFRMGFQLLDQTRVLRLWGVYPIDNAYFMERVPSTDLRYVIGCLWGCINTHEEWGSVTLDDKEDFERTIRYYIQTGGVLRMNWIAPTTRFYSEPGGMQVERTEERVTQSATDLALRYPDFCSLNTSKASGHVELRLRDKRKGEP